MDGEEGEHGGKNPLCVVGRVKKVGITSHPITSCKVLGGLTGSGCN